MLMTSISFLFVMIGGSFGDVPPCFTNNRTWHSDDVENVLTNIDNVYLCQEACATTDCRGFTYYSQDNQHLPRMCVMFHSISREEDCIDCISGPSSCSCSSSFSCDVTSENTIDIIPNTQTETECQNICYNSQGCNFYTYFNQQNVLEGMCFIFTSCDQTDDTCSGCFSGPPTCSTTTEAPTETPTEPSTDAPTDAPTDVPTVAPACQNYRLMDDSTRSVNHGREDYCDESDHSYTSPDWKGAGWYRMIEPAGLQMPEYPPDVHSCGTTLPGWLKGSHPAVQDGEVEGTVCFANYGVTCYWSTSIKILDCGPFYVYKFNDTPYCVLRYCGM